MQISDIATGPIAIPPLATAKTGTQVVAPYPMTQALADRWLRANALRAHPVSGGRADGILYGSRFGPAARCLAFWEPPVAPALRWRVTQPLGAILGLGAACATLDLALRL